MLTLCPAFRVSEIEETGDAIIHYEDGVIGYVVTLSPDKADIFGAFGDAASLAFASIAKHAGVNHDSAPMQIIYRAALGVSGRDIVSLDDANAAAIALARWYDERRPAVLAMVGAEA